MAKVTIKKNLLIVSIGTFEAIQALQRTFSVPLACVEGATEDQNFIRSGGLGLRSPGTGLPGVIARGTFRKPGEKSLSLWGRNQEIVVIQLRNYKWDRVVVGCEDAKSLASMINKAIAK
ncbi:MAG: hypothetical protein KAZ95_01455 [Rhodoluna sp.]|jgi:hypothetical protein|nr:hypothetical protein [Rhodoluna sp.]